MLGRREAVTTKEAQMRKEGGKGPGGWGRETKPLLASCDGRDHTHTREPPPGSQSAMVMSRVQV